MVGLLVHQNRKRSSQITFRRFEQRPLARCACLAWAILLGYFIWGEVPSLGVFAGIALVVASGLFILYREQRLARIRESNLPRLR